MSDRSNKRNKGNRLLPAVLDYNGTVTPDRIYASIPRSQDIDEGFRDLTCRDVLHAVDAFAWWLTDRYGRSENFETIGYVGLNDLRYPMFFYAAMKAGYKALFISPRNPIPQNVSLLIQTECTKFFHSPELASLATGLERAMAGSLGVVASIAPLDDWIASYTKPCPFQKSFEEAKYDPVLVLHSSGSTGAPKAITETHQYFANSDRSLPPVEGRELGGLTLFDYDGGGYFYSPFPGFHLAGVTAMCNYPVFMKSASIVLGLPDRPPTAQMLHQIMSQKQLRLLYSPPSIIEQLAQIPKAMEQLKKLDVVIYSGGPLAKSCGDILSKHVKLSQIYGSTEVGNVPSLLPKPDDWEFLQFHPAWKAYMEPSVDGASELIIKKDAEADQYRSIAGTILRTETQYRTRDLFIPHPTKSDLWRFYGRNDDIIVFSNSFKWNPVPSENIILGYPKLSGVLILGDRRPQAAVLLEPKELVQSTESFIEDIWPLIEKANQQAQKQGQLVRSKIGIVKPGALIRAPKGTIVRGLSIHKFKDIIEQLYAEDHVAQITPGYPVLAKPYDLSSAILDFVRSCVHQVSCVASAGDDDDFFILGLNSLETIELARTLKAGLKPQYEYERLSFLTSQFVFDHPTTTSLSSAIYQALTTSQVLSKGTDEGMLSAILAKYTNEIPSQPLDNRSSRTTNLHIVLTGSTGSLGCHLLQNLLKNPKVAKVYCLDRDSNAQAKAERVLSTSSQDFSKAVFLKAQLGETKFGLSPQNFKLLEQVDIILHNAWKVDFNHPLASFEPQIRAVTHFALLALSSIHKMRIMFVSSISSVINYNISSRHKAPIPETIIEEHSASHGIGYSQSKHVSERILASAAAKAGVLATILRVGQIAGPIESCPSSSSSALAHTKPWNKQEWVPALILTSKNLGYLPSNLTPVDWIPVDKLALIISDLMNHDVANSNETLGVYNLVNPHTVSWSSLVPSVIAGLGTNNDNSNNDNSSGSPPSCATIPLADWIYMLKSRDRESPSEVARFPALKILEFYESMLESLRKSQGGEDGNGKVFATERAEQASSTMSGLDGVSREWMRMWMEGWKF